MKIQRWAVALTAINFVLLLIALFFFLSPLQLATAKEISPALRARSLELVAEDGTIRARINIEDDGTVVFRMTDQEGNIRMKLGASAEGSGLVLMNDFTEPGVHLLANSTGTTATLTTKDGQQEVIAP
jgi:hypothetical protein